ncbi:MAG: DHA2 family efflux MFS transporter permease subunit [Desulfobacterota bacterium]|nr:DHA2 family efflux MFS transporter permease subunit [Thermodesulfobacteriota bacterium]
MPYSKNNQSGSKWIAAGIVMIGIFITLLDGTIVDVVLPKMMASLNTDTYGVQWVIIAYLIAAAIAMTSVDWLGSVLGHRYTYLVGLVIFTFFSALCGQASDIGFMVFSRFCQGLGEGIVVPIGMTILCEAFPEEERGMALGVYGLGASCAPALGPTLGGIITEHLSWRWIFYVNLPIGLFGIFLTLVVLWETGDRSLQPKRFDLPGFFTMAIAFGSFITFLSKGQEKGWLQSDFILALIIIFCVSLPLFIWIELTTEYPLFDLRIFRYRNFTLSMLCMFAMSAAIYGIFMMIPLYLERFRQFTTLTTGLTMLPGSIMAGVGVFIAGYLSDKYDPQKLFLYSSVFMFLTGLLLSSIDMDTERTTIVVLFMLWNIPLAFNFPPIQAIGFSGVPDDKISLVSCGQNASRLLAGSVGTAIAVTILERRADLFFETFGRHVSYDNIVAMNTLGSLSGYLHIHGTPLQMLQVKSLKMIELYLTVKSYIYAVKSDILWMTIIGLFAVVFCLFMKQQTGIQGRKHVPIH